jgi:hypothetical protein
MFNQKRNLKYPSLFLICFFISTALYLNSCGRFFIKDEGLENKSIGELSVDRAVDRGCLIKNASPFVKSSADNTTSTLAVAEITQTAGGDGYYTGSFVVPSSGISFLLSIFKDSDAIVEFYSLADPDGTDILSASSTPNLYNDASGSLGSSGYANVLVPQSPSFSAKAGTWTFKAYNNDRVSIALRTGSTPSAATITIQPYITGTTWSAGDISVALIIMKRIYSKNGITLTVKSTITISDTQYATVSKTFTNSTTSALVSQGVTEGVNLFFVQGQLVNSSILGNAAGIPGSMGIANSWNGVLIFLNPHATGTTTLDAQLLGETAAHEMGHQLGLFHTTESGGTQFDILSDTLECQKSTQDNNSDWKVSAEECEGYGGENLMFWTSWSSSSRSAGKKQEVLCNQQQQVLKYSPLAK